MDPKTDLQTKDCDICLTSYPSTHLLAWNCGSCTWCFECITCGITSAPQKSDWPQDWCGHSNPLPIPLLVILLRSKHRIDARVYEEWDGKLREWGTVQCPSCLREEVECSDDWRKRAPSPDPLFSAFKKVKTEIVVEEDEEDENAEEDLDDFDSERSLIAALEDEEDEDEYIYDDEEEDVEILVDEDEDGNGDEDEDEEYENFGDDEEMEEDWPNY